MKDVRYRFRFVMPEGTTTATPILQVQSFEIRGDCLGEYSCAPSLWTTVETVYDDRAFKDAQDQQ